MAEDGQDRWRRIDALFTEALDRPAEERAALLDAACEDDPDLRREIEDLLDAHEAAEDFLADPVARLGVPPLPGIDETLTAEVDEEGDAATRQGQRISHYTLLEKLGGGGMGVVYTQNKRLLGIYSSLKGALSLASAFTRRSQVVHGK